MKQSSKKILFLVTVLALETQLTFSAQERHQPKGYRILEQMGAAQSVKSSLNGHLALIAPDNSITTWSMSRGGIQQTSGPLNLRAHKIHYDPTTVWAFSSRGLVAFYDANNGGISLLDINTKKVSLTVPISMVSIENMSFSANGKTLLCYSSTDQAIVTIDLKGNEVARLDLGELKTPLNISMAAGSGLAILSPDGQQLASINADNNSIRIDDLSSKKMTLELPLNEKLVLMRNSLVFDAKNNRIGAIVADMVTTGHTRYAQGFYMIVWDLVTQEQLCNIALGSFLAIENPSLWTLLGTDRVIGAFNGDVIMWNLVELVRRHKKMR